MTRMLFSPYPVPNLKVYRAFTILGWLAGVVAGAWVIINPPNPYEGLGLALTTMWGVFLAVGSTLVVAGHTLREYKIEIPGLVLSLGGIAIYAYLSWVATLTDMPDSGPRASLLVLLACMVVARLRVLFYVDREGRRMAELRVRASE